MSRLAEVMRTDYVTVAPEDTLGEAAEKLVAVNVGAAVVKDFGRLIGILTERDIMRAVAGRVHTSEARVREWMTAEPLTASAETSVEEAAQTMLDHGFRHLPVVDEDTVLGVVSLRRIVAAQGIDAPGPD
jgi:CBS domain-containing protein